VRKRPSRQVCAKKFHGVCLFCEETDYALLDAHRIIPGAAGGKYLPTNIVIVCSNCHRKIHAGTLTIDRKYPSTDGWVVRYLENGVEMLKKEPTRLDRPQVGGI
jgi:cytochrome c553